LLARAVAKIFRGLDRSAAGRNTQAYENGKLPTLRGTVAPGKKNDQPMQVKMCGYTNR